MGWEAQVSTPCSAYPRKPRPRMKSAMTEYSLRTKQTLQSGTHGQFECERYQFFYSPCIVMFFIIVLKQNLFNAMPAS